MCLPVFQGCIVLPVMFKATLIHDLVYANVEQRINSAGRGAGIRCVTANSYIKITDGAS